MDQAARIKDAEKYLGVAEALLKRYFLSNFESVYVRDVLLKLVDREAEKVRRAKSAVNTPS